MELNDERPAANKGRKRIQRKRTLNCLGSKNISRRYRAKSRFSSFPPLAHSFARHPFASLLSLSTSANRLFLVYTSLAGASFSSHTGLQSSSPMMSLLNNSNPAAVDASAPELLLDHHVKYIQALDTVIHLSTAGNCSITFVVRYLASSSRLLLDCIMSLRPVRSITPVEKE